MLVRKANVAEFDEIRAFYHKMTDWLDTVPYGPGWKKDIYPAPDAIMSALKQGELWVCEADGKYAASMIVNSENNEEYSLVEWPCDAKGDEVFVIHALGVMPEYHGKGVSGKMVQHAISLAKAENKKAMRLDVLAGNLPAERLYPKHGFELIATIEMFYEDTGLTLYKLYELAL